MTEELRDNVSDWRTCYTFVPLGFGDTRFVYGPHTSPTSGSGLSGSCGGCDGAYGSRAASVDALEATARGAGGPIGLVGKSWRLGSSCNVHEHTTIHPVRGLYGPKVRARADALSKKQDFEKSLDFLTCPTPVNGLRLLCT